MFASHRLSGLLNCFSMNPVFLRNEWLQGYFYLFHTCQSALIKTIYSEIHQIISASSNQASTHDRREKQNIPQLWSAPEGLTKVWLHVQSSLPQGLRCVYVGDLGAYLHLSPPQETESMNKNCCSCLNRVWRSFPKQSGSCHIKSPQSLSDEQSSRL